MVRAVNGLLFFWKSVEDFGRFVWIPKDVKNKKSFEYQFQRFLKWEIREDVDAMKPKNGGKGVFR